ncbi:MAG: WecB/TagA/CpsF family glycosyltransferase [Chthonomonas sp.]|nr:WecB/TagA/CpsF family glycosyltransferase [Chthonomonas sp.]
MSSTSTRPIELIPTVQILGTPISTLDMEQTLEQLQKWIREDTPRLVITADATALVIAEEKPRFQEVLHKASLITADSVGVIWAMKRAGVKSPSKVSGVEIVDRLCEISSRTGIKLYFIGSEPGITDRAAEKMRLKYPGVNIVGTHHGFFPADSDEVVAQEIARTQPDVIFAAMGMPRQEEFILRTMEITRAKIGMGVGGSFDVFSGKTKRAPKLLQALRLEWLWRLMLNPSKISKVKSLPKFVRLILTRS